jgi:hypothetical protein
VLSGWGIQTRAARPEPNHPPLHRRARVRPQIRVTTPLTALVGSDEPWDLDGHGPITAQQARIVRGRRGADPPAEGAIVHDHLYEFLTWLNARTWTREWPKYRAPNFANPGQVPPTRITRS